MAERSFSGWKLPAKDRERLLERFPPSYSEVVADHVTAGDGASSPSAPRARAGRVVGTVDDGRGLQALVVEIEGTTRRPDGSTYHITWSLDRNAGRKPVQSNDLLREKGWQAVDPLSITLEPQPGG